MSPTTTQPGTRQPKDTSTATDVPARPDAVEQSLERAAEQVFLSPRVVDQRAFDDLAGALHRVVREATTQGKSLMNTGEQVRGLTDQLRALMRELQQRTDAATKVLPMLEAQNKRVQELTGRVTHEAALTKAREVRDLVIKAVDEERAKAVAAARAQLEAEVRETVRAIVRDEVERARAGIAEAVDLRAAEAERRTEAAATEVSEQLTALRADAARIVAEARQGLQTVAPSPRTGADTGSADHRIHAVVAAANASISASAEDALSRVGTRVQELRESVLTHDRLAEEVRTLAGRAEFLINELSARVEAAAHANDRLHEDPPAAPGVGHTTPTVDAATTDMLVRDLANATMHAQQAGAWLVQLLGAADQLGRNLDAAMRTARPH
ncbi:MAG: hypothetical protein U0637_13635 [Phycisphaerales bacterium]